MRTIMRTIKSATGTVTFSTKIIIKVAEPHHFPKDYWENERQSVTGTVTFSAKIINKVAEPHHFPKDYLENLRRSATGTVTVSTKIDENCYKSCGAASFFWGLLREVLYSLPQVQ
jgi:hypothetical protein